MISVETIEANGQKYASIVRNQEFHPGIEFISDPEDEFQLGFMCREEGYKINPHFHKEQRRNIYSTTEVLFIKNGAVKVQFYDDCLIEISETVLHSGDIIILYSGGHGFQFEKNTVMVEVKQGPYIQAEDKKFI